jgi:hypothetical protein
VTASAITGPPGAWHPLEPKLRPRSDALVQAERSTARAAMAAGRHFEWLVMPG